MEATRSRAVERFKAKFTRSPGPCWTWTGTRDANGYGQFSVGKKNYRAQELRVGA